MNKTLNQIIKDNNTYATGNTLVVELNQKTLKNLEKHKRMISELKKLGPQEIKEWQDNTTDIVYLQVTMNQFYANQIGRSLKKG